MSTSTNKLIPDLFKLEPLDRTNNRRWSQMMVIFFKQLEVYYVLLNPLDTKKSEDSATIPKDLDVLATKVKFEKDNKMIHWRRNMESIMQWVKKYLVGEWIKFQMTNDNPIIDQVHIYEKLVSNILAEGIE
ncbi:hypothetical protein J1N35_034193, partial [Gossypium stocksii]